jgi:hypothetical protein
MNLGENRIGMRIRRLAWSPAVPRFPHSQAIPDRVHNSLLGWAHYQVRSDLAIRRHWQLVLCCAFTFCWWANTDLLLEEEAPPGVVLEEEDASTSASMVQRGGKGGPKAGIFCAGQRH